MAKSNLSFKRSTTDKLAVKGILSDDCKTITYTDEYDEEQTAEVSDLIHAFKGQELTLTVALKLDEDLELIPTED